LGVKRKKGWSVGAAQKKGWTVVVHRRDAPTFSCTGKQKVGASRCREFATKGWSVGRFIEKVGASSIHELKGRIVAPMPRKGWTVGDAQEKGWSVISGPAKGWSVTQRLERRSILTEGWSVGTVPEKGWSVSAVREKGGSVAVSGPTLQPFHSL
jgi:hypothetical protein